MTGVHIKRAVSSGDGPQPGYRSARSRGLSTSSQSVVKFEPHSSAAGTRSDVAVPSDSLLKTAKSSDLVSKSKEESGMAVLGWVEGGSVEARYN